MRGSSKVVAGVMALALLSGCYGPFHLTRKVWRWNGEVSENKWIVEVVFLACSFFPVYSAASLLDGLLFNSIEFWTGSNPISASTAPESSTRVASGDSHAVISRVAGETGEQLLVQQFEHGQPAGSLRLERRDGVTVATDESGKTLLTAQLLPDGSMLVTDASGKKVAYHSPRQVARLLETSRQAR